MEDILKSIEYYNNLGYIVTECKYHNNSIIVEFDSDIYVRYPCNEYYGGNIFDNIKKMLQTGRIVRLDQPPIYKEFLSKYGNIPIDSIQVCKKPIQKIFDKIINVISFGKWGDTKSELGYDDMFHLFLYIRLKTGERLRMEKNEILNIAHVNYSDIKNDPYVKCMMVPYNKLSPLTLNELNNNAVEVFGQDQIYIYRGDSWNCQKFVTNILEASNLLAYSGQIGGESYSQKLYDFINQDTFKLISSLPKITQRLIQGTTDLAGFFNFLTNG